MGYPHLALATTFGKHGFMWDRVAAAAGAHDWMSRYVHAWETNDPDEIRSLFTQDAEYRDGPSERPWVGREAILEGWMNQKDDPGTWSFDYELTAVDGDVAVVRGRTRYPTATAKSRHYDNLMVIRLVAGRARSFTDWWVIPDGSDADA